MRTIIHSRFGFARLARFFAVAGSAAAVASVASTAHAQQAGLTNKPIPNVLLLVDTSGSMERMVDGSLPADNRDPVTGGTITTAPFNACSPGVQSNPNRWGLLLQSLTGSFQPYFSCEAMTRASGSRFANEYKIGSAAPYDTDYILPYHRPMTGTGAGTCVNVPYRLPGGAGVGGGGYSDASDASAFPSDAIQSFLQSHLVAVNGGALGGLPSAQTCNFDQAADGQLDAVKDFVRFGLMTFDNDTRPNIGVSGGPFPTAGSVLTTPAGQPFLGQWSYLRSPSNPFGSGAAQGAPPACSLIDFEAGARHWAAPPWEGRMVAFPNPLGSLLDVQTTNQQIQQVLLTTRPYGATPIDGLLDDARDYLWYNDYGPWGSQPGYADPFVKASAHCRDQYIILLTDGAPNLDMRPDCQGTGGNCPFQEGWKIAEQLYNNGPGNRSKVPTFVIGFSVNGSNSANIPNDGFPGSLAAADRTCKKWYADMGPDGGNQDPKVMETRCNALNPPTGSTAEACCKLNKIALYGSGGPTSPTPVLPAFFADSAADLVIAFSRILAQVSKVATTRTTPAAAPNVNLGGQQANASYVASFIPNARKVWSGEIDRTRNTCVGTTPTTAAQDPEKGDLYSVNTAIQAINGRRWFFTAVGDPTGTASGITTVDSYRTIRPYSSGAPADGIPVYRAQEVGGVNNSLFSTSNFAGALGITPTTCKRSQYVAPGGATSIMPALGAAQCTEVIWDFATAFAGPVSFSSFDFNLRCRTGNTSSSVATTGTCSIGGNSCSINDPGATCLVPGETCVPECSALGAVFRSVPTVVGPPSGFLREEGWRQYQAALSGDGTTTGRRPVLFVATTDGVLHAFRAMPDVGADAPSSNYELWGFVPPAVLPRLATNYPGGQQVLLDGSPVVREVVWDRNASSSDPANDWHTTLVASLGSGGGGYYALNVSDADCGGRANTGHCRTANAWEQPSPGAGASNLASVSVGATATGGRKKGPHFLWQITDIEKDSSGTDQARDTRTSVAGDNKSFVALFGQQTSTPAIATVQVRAGAGSPVRQVGVAILPGGIDGPPVRNASCPRAVTGAYGGFNATADVGDTANLNRRAAVRQWGKLNCNSPVAGRGVTLVRLDNGEILRHFGRKNQDVPNRIKNVTTDSPFDSPVTGTPVIYPASLGSATQRAFIGDADGTLWRLDLSAVCDLTDMNACTWNVKLFADVVAKSTPLAGAAESQPIVIPPVVSQSTSGSLVVNVATGDQENIVPSTEVNYVMSIEELRTTQRASLRWFETLPNAERVTGPMAVFDRTLYFATFTPQQTAGSDVCGSTAKSYLWGADYFNAATPGTPSSGGAPRWCAGAVSATGSCGVALTLKEDVTTSIMGGSAQIIPGVAVRNSLSCITSGGLTDDFGTGITGITPSKFELSFNWSAPRGAAALPGAASATMNKQVQTPRYNASLDAWAFVTD